MHLSRFRGSLAEGMPRCEAPGYITMTNKILLLGTSTLLLAGLAGCQSAKPSDTLLLKKDPGSSVTYRAPGENDVPYAKNVVYVPRDAKFSLSLEALNPGWLHQENISRQENSSAVASFFAGDPGLAGKNLWLLITIRTLSTDDALQIESKRISRASLVKYDMRSFGLIPLTVDEITPFSLEANTDYEVQIRLYDVKKAFQHASFENRAGLSGVARTTWATARNTFKSLVGTPAENPSAEPAGDIGIERQLIAAGGEVRFDARFAIYRNADSLAPRLPEDDARGGVLVNRYQLTDPHNRRTTDRRAPANETRFTDAESYLDRLQTLESVEVPGREDAFLRFRIEAMWSPVARALAQIQAAPVAPENVSEEQARAAESLAVIARETFLKASEDEKEARLAASETLRKSDLANSGGQLDETARTLSLKTQEVTAARTAMETAQTRAREARQAVEASASRAAQTANAEKTVALANATLEDARRAAEAAVRELDASRAALQQARDSAEAARLKKEEWLQAEARATRRRDAAREELATLARKLESRPDDADLRQKVAALELETQDAAKAVDTAVSEWKLAQKDQEAKLAGIADRAEAVAQKRNILAEVEQEKQRARAAKDKADAVLNGADVADPRPAILRARSL